MNYETHKEFMLDLKKFINGEVSKEYMDEMWSGRPITTEEEYEADKGYEAKRSALEDANRSLI